MFKCNIGIFTPTNKKKLSYDAKSGIPFVKMLSRDKVSRNPICLSYNDSPNLNQQLEKLSTIKRVISPNFDYFKSRYRENQKLPSFMENVNSRMAITGLSFEMLQSNRYSLIENMRPIYSSLNEKKSFRVVPKQRHTPLYINYAPEKLLK